MSRENKRNLFRASLTLAFTIVGYACTNSLSSRQIAFLIENNGVRHVQVMDSDGSNVHEIKTGLVDDGCPVWSPDGHRFLFIASDAIGATRQNLHIYIANSDGSGLSQLPLDQRDFGGVSWSPDGEQAVFSAGPSNSGLLNLYVVGINGTNESKLTDHSFSRDISPHWSPDGQHIVFSANPGAAHSENYNFDIYVIDLNGDNLTRLTDSEELDFTFNPPVDLGPRWSPDGKRILFYFTQLATDFQKGSNIYVMDSDGENRIQITNDSSPIMNINPDWSPDGLSIVFASNRDYPEDPSMFDIYRMNADGTNVTRLTSSGNTMCPDW